MNMPDFSNAKIYKITNDIDDEIYIGSTTQRLCDRWKYHRWASKTLKSKLYSHIHSVGLDHFKIELIENYPCSTKKELHSRECIFIKEQGSLNKIIPGRTIKQWGIDNAERKKETAKRYAQCEKKKEYDRKYRLENRELINEKKRKRRLEEKIKKNNLAN